MTLPDIILLRPAWLLALPVLAVSGWWLYRRRSGVGDWTRVADPALMAAMAALGRIDRQAGRAPVLAGLAAATITVLALSGPAIERRDAVSFRNLDGVLFAVDASASVTQSPRWPRMQTMGRFGLAALGTRPGGLIVYGGDAYIATEMTNDAEQLGQTFSLIDAETVPDPGSRPGRALVMAAQRLEQAEVIAGDVVVMSDGAGLGPDTLAAADRIAAQGARLSFVALDAPTPLMTTHAEIAGGRVFTLDQTEAFSAFLGEDARTRLERQDFPLLFWQDLGRWMLILALVPLAFFFRRPTA